MIGVEIDSIFYFYLMLVFGGWLWEKILYYGLNVEVIDVMKVGIVEVVMGLCL